MEKLQTDSPLARRIVAAFIQFLNSVEPSPGVDIEGIEVAKECLADVFKPNLSAGCEQLDPSLLVHLFKEAEFDRIKVPEQPNPVQASSRDTKLLSTQSKKGVDSPVKSRVQEVGTANIDELYEQFHEGLENAGFFTNSSVEPSKYMDQVIKAKEVLQKIFKDISKEGSSSELNLKVLAEAFKVQGNAALSSKRYREAIELYTLAISLCCDNAVYYCNRAAAHTQLRNYKEAIEDCQKSIEIDPNYSKAYSRLGLIYYAQGNFQEAIEKGFAKALERDPTNTSIKENIKMAFERLEEIQKQNCDQASQDRAQSSQSNNRSNNHDAHGRGFSMDGSRFPSMPFNTSLPSEIASMFPSFMSMPTEAGHNVNDRSQENHSNSETGIRHEDSHTRVPLNGNINLTFEGGQMPENISGFMQNMFQMLSGSGNQPRSGEGSTHEGQQ